MVCGELREWPSKDLMAKILRDAGLPITVGRYSIRIEDCSRFIFQDYGGDLGDPVIDVDAASDEELLRDIQKVSMVLTNAKLAHRFEFYDDHDRLVHDINHDWPLSLSD